MTSKLNSTAYSIKLEKGAIFDVLQCYVENTLNLIYILYIKIEIHEEKNTFSNS
jgi:hypothetical protein